MFRFFRSIRRSLLAEGRLRDYIPYAVGEIFLVVIGILVALQINNWNEHRKTRQKERVYLAGIRQDLELNITSLKEFIEARRSTAESVAYLLEYFNGKPLTELDEFNYHNVNVMVWYPFIQHANTYNELVNSGNFAILSDPEIKTGLQNMQAEYGRIAFIENEMQQDYERYLYEVYFNLMDLEASLRNFDDLTGGGGTEPVRLDRDDAGQLIVNRLYKNGLVLSAYNSGMLVELYESMVDRTKRLIATIDSKYGI